MQFNYQNFQKRKQKEAQFLLITKGCIFFAVLFLAILLILISNKAKTAFLSTKIALEINLTNQTNLQNLDYRQIIKNALHEQFINQLNNPDISSINSIYQLISKISNLELKKEIKNNQNLLGNKFLFWFSASSKLDVAFKYHNQHNLNSLQQKILQQLQEQQKIKTTFNWQFWQYGDSREPEIAGIASSLVGSFLTMSIFLLMSMPVAVACGFYLEEFAKKNLFTSIIEVSLNNLAAVPSIIYGLLGLIIYLQTLKLPRSSSLVGGLTLFMLVLPIIIIATRNAIKNVPKNIRDAALGLGASPFQIVLHHLLPLSLPGIMTGTILAVSRALGETAPLLMIGMIAFIADIPQKFSDPATVLPVQIYLWSDSQELGFAEKTSAAILVLLFFLILLNLSAVLIRKKFEKKW
jgi:phosphate transport system permease protein